VADRYVVLCGGDAGRAVQPLHFPDLPALDERDDLSGRPGPSGTPGTVQVVLVVVGRVELHDQVDVIDVDAASGDVGGDEHPGVPGRERVERTLPLALVAVAVDSGRTDTRTL
jgi:hypothetical protein